MNMYERSYMEVQRVLDKALGPNVEDGAGAGIVEDVALIAQQRDDARTALERVTSERDAAEQEIARLLNRITEISGERDDARAERDTLRQHILDIDAHATPYGDIPEEPGWVGTYLLTAGALHRALGRIGHSAPKCQAEDDNARLLEAVEANQEMRRAAEALLIEVADECNEARAEVVRLGRELELAIAHDRQPYPTAEAYERACEALHKQRDRAEVAEAKVLTEEQEDAIRALLSLVHYDDLAMSWLAKVPLPLRSAGEL